MTGFLKRARLQYRSVQPWVIWALGAGFFLTEYFARVDPSIIASQLMMHFHVGTLAIGTLSAAFYVTYAGMQIPVGSLIDRFGPHRLLTAMAMVCGLACFLFAWGQNLETAILARALMGFAAAFAFVGAMKLATLWFEPKRLGLLAGLTQGMGMLGAAFGEGFFAFIVKSFGWRATIAAIGYTLIALAVVIGFVVRDKRPTLLRHRTQPEHQQVGIAEGLAIVFRNRQTWVNALFVGLIYAPTGAFAELWGPTYLHLRYQLSIDSASIAVSAIFIGLLIGCIVVGILSDFFRRRRIFMLISAVLSLIFLSAVILMPLSWQPSYAFIVGLLFCYGLSNGGLSLGYAVACEINPLPVSGLSVAFANMASVAIAMVLQPVIGALVEWFWHGSMVDGAQLYSAADYQRAMIILPICLLLTIVTVFFVRETNCQRR